MKPIDLLSITLSSFALLASIVGWFVTYRLNLNANKETLRRTILNEVRKEFNTAIHSYNDWNGELVARLSFLITRYEHGKMFSDPKAFPYELNVLRVLVNDRRSHDWIMRLEEYESLIPFTSKIRIVLLHRGRQIIEELNDAINKAEKDPTLLLLKQVDEFKQRLLDMTAFTWDVFIHIQNHCLSDLTDHCVPSRKPLVPGVPIVVLGTDGKLTLGESDV